MQKKIELVPQKGLVFEGCTINIGDSIDTVINSFGSYDTARVNEYYFVENYIIHVLVDDNRLVTDVEVCNVENYPVYVEGKCISSMKRDELIQFLARINKEDPVPDGYNSLAFKNIGLELWYQSSLEEAEDVIAEMKEDGIYTKEKAEQEMNLAYYFGTVGFPCV